MAVPKRKTSKAKGRSRRAANWKLDRPSRSLRPRCGVAKAPQRDKVHVLVSVSHKLSSAWRGNVA